MLHYVFSVQSYSWCFGRSGNWWALSLVCCGISCHLPTHGKIQNPIGAEFLLEQVSFCLPQTHGLWAGGISIVTDTSSWAVQWIFTALMFVKGASSEESKNLLCSRLCKEATDIYDLQHRTRFRARKYTWTAQGVNHWPRLPWAWGISITSGFQKEIRWMSARNNAGIVAPAADRGMD